MMVATMPHHIAGVRRFELPLRGESLAAWSNSWFIRSPSGRSRNAEKNSTKITVASLSKHRQHLVPQRCVALRLGRRRLRRADRIGRREAADQTGLELG